MQTVFLEFQLKYSIEVGVNNNNNTEKYTEVCTGFPMIFKRNCLQGNLNCESEYYFLNHSVLEISQQNNHSLFFHNLGWKGKSARRYNFLNHSVLEISQQNNY